MRKRENASPSSIKCLFEVNYIRYPNADIKPHDTVTTGRDVARTYVYMGECVLYTHTAVNDRSRYIYMCVCVCVVRVRGNVTDTTTTEQLTSVGMK